MKVLKILLFFTAILSLNAKKITLQFQGGKLTADSSILQNSVTLKNLLDEADVDQIPIPNIDKKTGEKIIELLTFIEQNKNEDNLQDLLEEQLKSIKNNQEIVNIVNAANYLDIKIILDSFFNLIEKNENLLTSILKEYQLIPDDLFIQIIQKLPLYKKVNCQECKKRKYFDTGLEVNFNASSIVASGKDDHLYIFDRNGSLTGSNTDKEYEFPQISNDGSTIIAINRDKNFSMSPEGFLNIFDRNGILIGSNTDRKYTSPQISADGSTIIAIDHDQHLYIFDRSGNVIAKNTDRKYNKCVGFPTVSYDGSTIVALAENNQLYILNRNGKLINSDSVRRYNNYVMSSDGYTVVGIGLGTEDYGHLYIFDNNGQLLGSITDKEYDLPEISSDGSTIVANNKGNLYIFNRKGNLVGSDTNRKYDHYIISHDGSTIAAIGKYGNHLYIFDKNLNLIGMNSDKRYYNFKISFDGSTIFAKGMDDKYLYIFDKSGNIIGSDTGRKYQFKPQITPDGSTIAIVDFDYNLCIFYKYYLLNQVINKLEETKRQEFIEKLKSLGINLEMDQ